MCLRVGCRSTVCAPTTCIANARYRLPAKIAAITIVVVGLSLSIFAIAFSIIHFQLPVADFTGMPQINDSDTWRIESLIIAGHSVTPDPDALFFFNVFNTCEYGKGAQPTGYPRAANITLAAYLIVPITPMSNGSEPDPVG